jgi:hypothetical protein
MVINTTKSREVFIDFQADGSEKPMGLTVENNKSSSPSPLLFLSVSQLKNLY